MMFRWIRYYLKSCVKPNFLFHWRADTNSFISLVLGKILNNIFLICCVDAPPPTWEQLENGLVAVRTVVHGLVDYIQNHSKKGADQQQVRGKLAV